MSRSSGFVPVPFPLVGKILVVAGAIVLVLYLLSIGFQWFTLPVLAVALGAVGMLIGLYLIFVIHKKEADSN